MNLHRVFLHLTNMDWNIVPWKSKECLLLLLLSFVLVTHANVSDVRLTSTERSITLTFTPNLAATNYTASFRLSQGYVFTDYPYEPPYSGPISVVHDPLLPGHRYVVQICENETLSSTRVFEREIATVPLQPLSVEAIDRGSSFLFLQWESQLNLTYDGHEVYYMHQNSSWEMENGTQDTTFNLTGLDAGHPYQVYVIAITAGVRSQRSETISTPTLPLPPKNLTAAAVGSTQITLSWLPQTNSYQDSFKVKFARNGTRTLTDTNCNQSPCTLTPGRPAGQAINMFVYAVSQGFTSDPATISHSTEPGNVRQFSGEEGVGSLKLRWSAPVNSVQESYRLTLTSIVDNHHRDYSIPADSEQLTYFLDSLVGGYVYNVEVRAVSKYAEGDADSATLRTMCESGRYGPDCKECSQFCNTNVTGENESPCHHVTGVCVYGCVQGYEGFFCEPKKQSSSSQSSSSSDLGVGLGIGLGVAALLFLVGVAIYCYRRKSQTSRRQVPPGYDTAGPTTDVHNYSDLFRSADDYSLPTDLQSSSVAPTSPPENSPQDRVQSENADIGHYEEIGQVSLNEESAGKYQNLPSRATAAGKDNAGYANV